MGIIKLRRHLVALVLTIIEIIVWTVSSIFYGILGFNVTTWIFAVIWLIILIIDWNIPKVTIWFDKPINVN